MFLVSHHIQSHKPEGILWFSFPLFLFFKTSLFWCKHVWPHVLKICDKSTSIDWQRRCVSQLNPCLCNFWEETINLIQTLETELQNLWPSVLVALWSSSSYAILKMILICDRQTQISLKHVLGTRLYFDCKISGFWCRTWNLTLVSELTGLM